jgi:TRAP-type C4-dicarboxylate transport system permease small subunit
VQRLLAAARWLSDALVAALLFAMMTLTFLDVIGRYMLHRPVMGSTELIQYMLALLIFIALPVVTAREEHISISIVEGLLGSRANAVRRILLRVVCAAIMLAVSWYMWSHAKMLAENRDVIGYLLLPVAPAAYAVSVLSGLTAATFLGMAVAEAARWRSRSPAS